MREPITDPQIRLMSDAELSVRIFLRQSFRVLAVAFALASLPFFTRAVRILVTHGKCCTPAISGQR